MAGKAKPPAKVQAASEEKAGDTVVLPNASNLRKRTPQITRAKRDDKPRKAQRAQVRLAKAKPAGGVPTSPSTKGLSLKLPKEGKADLIQRRLKKKSPWFQSILDPLHGADAKIPDATGVETGTLQCVDRITVSAGSSGVAACRILTPYASSTSGSPDVVVDPSNDYAGGAGNPIKWGLLGLTALPTTDALLAYSDGARVVSAAIYCQSLASLSDNSGEMICYINPFPESNFTTTTPLTEYLNHYKTAVIPVNNNQPGCVRWYPINEGGGEYDMFYAPQNPLWGSGNFDVTQVPLYEMGIICNGVADGSVFLFTIVVNYEFTPFENAINILDARPSPVDAQEVDLVENWVQTMEPASITTNRIVATPPESVPTEEPGEGSGFGMFFEVIKEIAPLALGMLAL